MPVVAFLIDTVYDVCVFQFCKNQREFSIWWFAAARLAWGAVKWIISPRKEGSSKRVLPQLYDFTLDEQKEILQASVKIPSWVHFPDLERAEWINVVLARIWTPFGRYMNRLFKEWLEPLIQTAIGNKVSFKFDKVDFGSIPIRLSGAKAYKENVDRREIILDLEVYYNGDAELTVTISGIKAGVKNIQLRGTLRIVLKPVLMDIPFLGGVEFYFLNPPVIDFEMTNLLNAPGFSIIKQTVHQQIMDNLKWFLVLPNKFGMPFTPQMSYKDFMFELPVGMLRVQVIAGKNLPVADLALLSAGTSDPYIKLHLGAKEVRTKTILKTVNPKWDEVFDFIVTEPSGQLLSLSLYDQDIGKDDYLGNVTIDSGRVRIGAESAGHWYNINGTPNGQLQLNLSWFELTADKEDLTASMNNNKLLTHYSDKPLTSAILLVLVDSANDLPRVVAAGKDRDPNASVVMSLGHQSFITRTVMHSRLPIWEQQNLFYVHDPLTENLIVLIKDDTSILPLGTLEFSLASLLEADNFAMEHPFPLKGSGPNSTIILRMVLRITTNAEVRNNLLKSEMRTDIASALVLPSPNLSNCTGNFELDTEGIPLGKTKSINQLNLNFRTTPRISIVLFYQSRSNELTVEIVEACSLDNLWEAAKRSKQKVFVICSLLPTKQKHVTGEGTNEDNPSFKEKFNFALKTKIDIRQCTLSLKVVSGNRMFNDLLGETKIPLRFLNLTDKISTWYQLISNGRDDASGRSSHLTQSL